MRRLANPQLSSSGEETVAQYRRALWEHEDLTGASRRNYLSDLRHFAAWYEAQFIQWIDEISSPQTTFDPRAFPLYLLRAFLCSHLGKPKRLSQSVRLAKLSKSTRSKRSSSMSARMTSAIVLGIAWLSLFRTIGSHKSWGITHWIPLDSIFKEQSKISNKPLKQ